MLCRNIIIGGIAELSIIYTILIFSAIILIHELGHFITAKLSGITIHEFSLGMGPAIYKFKAPKVTYSIRLFPIGGYVAMEGEDSESNDENAFSKKPIWKRMIVILAGAFMNLLLGFLIMVGIYSQQQAYNSTTVAEFMPNAVTQASGLEAGDKIVKMNSTTIFADRDMLFELMRDSDGIIDMQVIRNGEKVRLPQVKFDVVGDGEAKQLNIDFKVLGIKRTFFSVLDYSFRSTVSLARNSWTSIGDLVTGKLGISDLSGPVGVGQVVNQASSQGFKSLLMLASLISISIGMFNLLPFPALDGGRFVFLVIEAIRKKPMNPKIEGYVNAAGLMLLFGLMIVITLKDIIKLF